ncbi:MAG: GerMN domain-containing protein [Snowella sp.]|nr:GerMN domain-containing protein [Snowella sp.]
MARKNQSRSTNFAVGAIIAILVAGTGTAWWAFHSLTPSSPTRSPKVETIPSPSLPAHQDTTQSPQTNLVQSQAKTYWLTTQDEQIELIGSPVLVPKNADKNQIIQTALEQLLTQTPTASASTAIPSETRLLSVKVDNQGVYVDLSANFTEGGGSASMTGRLGQVIYTASSVDPQTLIWLSVEGKPLETLGGEGLMVEQPMTRQWFKDNFN